MPIDSALALGASGSPVTTSWQKRDVILYHLGIGAGIDRATDPAELEYTYEPSLKVLPTFAVVPGLRAIPDPNTFPGVDIDLSRMLHAEHEIIVHDVIPTAGSVTSTAWVADIWDKGDNALMVIQVESVDEAGTTQFINRLTMFLRGEGGFGGEPGSSAKNFAPERSPDARITRPTLRHQALIYRLSGDPNPLHADPQAASRAGFDSPILHGLCSYGVACKAVVDELLKGDVGQLASFKARFANVVLPGETLTTSMWNERNRILLATDACSEPRRVLSNAVIETR